jgi:hypothetical protein
MVNSMPKLDCPICQTGQPGFDSSNFVANFVKFQNHLFTLPLYATSMDFQYLLRFIYFYDCYQITNLQQ